MKMPNYFGWPGTVWLFSDPHFGDYNIINFERYEFKTIAEHNERIIKEINSTVAVGGTLIILGDLGHNWQNEIKKIKCEKKILILGNHDNCPKHVYYTYFDMVFDGPIFLNKFLLLSHEPWPGCGEYCINIHGHLHNSFLDLENYVCVSAKLINYKPITAESIYRRVDKLKRNNEHFLEEWYSDYYHYTTKVSDLPLTEDGRLLKNYKELKKEVEKYNSINHTSFKMRSVNWGKYDFSVNNVQEFIKNNLFKKEGGNR